MFLPKLLFLAKNDHFTCILGVCTRFSGTLVHIKSALVAGKVFWPKITLKTLKNDQK